MLTNLAAGLVVAVHTGFVALVVFGGFLAWRWPQALWAHLPAIGLTAILFVLGADCPLTDLEKFLRRLSGDSPYREGFVAHYLLPGVPEGVRSVGVPLVLSALTAMAYAVLLTRAKAHALTSTD